MKAGENSAVQAGNMGSRLGLPLPERTCQFFKESLKRIENKVPTVTTKLWSEAFFGRYSHLPGRQRYAKSFAWALANAPVYIYDHALLAGQWYSEPSADMGVIDADPQWQEYSPFHYSRKRIQEEIPEAWLLHGLFTDEFMDSPSHNMPQHPEAWVMGIVTSIPGHISWHWEWIVKYGVTGILARIADSRKRAATEDEMFVLDGMKDVLEALLAWTDRHVTALEEKVAASPSDLEMRKLLDICRRVPRYGARSFREAVQSFHFCYTATMIENNHGGNSPGRLDYHLWPYLERDMVEKCCDLKVARELIDELFIRFHERSLYTADGRVETIVVGGSHADGTPSINPLSRVMVESMAGLKITHPSVYIRMPENAPEDFIELAARDLLEGGNRAQVVSDPAVIKAMVFGGIPEEDARMYMCGGCMEIAPHGMNSDLLFVGFFNVPKVLELVLNGGICMNTGYRMLPELYCRTLADYSTFEDLYSAFEEQLAYCLNTSFRVIELNHEAFVKLRPRYLISSQIDDCIERRKLIHEGGARYEDWGSTPLGIPNLGDSLYAIRRAVFDEKFIAAGELLAALQTDFRGNELLRERLLGLPKFGQGHAGPDEMTIRVTRTVCDIYNVYRNPCGGKIKPMVMTFQMAPVAGKALAATADGRHAGITIAQGLTPQSIGMTKGITTAILSANSLPLELFSGGASSMWDIDSRYATVGNVTSLLKTFLATGGQMFQGNMTDVRELECAQAKPDQYENLMVRVGGYSGRFVALNKINQDDVIMRHRHDR